MAKDFLGRQTHDSVTIAAAYHRFCIGQCLLLGGQIQQIFDTFQKTYLNHGLFLTHTDDGGFSLFAPPDKPNSPPMTAAWRLKLEIDLLGVPG